METNWEMAHDARVRTCIVVAVGIPISELRDRWFVLARIALEGAGLNVP